MTVPLRRRIVELLASGSPFLIVVPLLLSSPTLRLAMDIDWEPRGKLDGLIYVIEVYSDVTALIIAATLTTGCAWAARRGILRLHPWWSPTPSTPAATTYAISALSTLHASR
jgi:hypothetical protein